MLIFKWVVHTGSDTAQRSVTFESTVSCLFQEVKQFLFVVGIASRTDTADIEWNVHSGSKLRSHHVFVVDFLDIGVLSNLLNLVLWLINEIVQPLRLFIGLLFKMLDTSHFKHMFAHELGDPQRQHRGRVRKVIRTFNNLSPIHHEWHGNLGSSLYLVHSLHNFIFNNHESQAWGSKVFLCSCIHDTKIVPQVLRGKISWSQSRTHVSYDDWIGLLSFDSVDHLSLECLIKFDSVDWFVLAIEEIFGVLIQLPGFNIRDRVLPFFQIFRISYSIHLVDSVIFFGFVGGSLTPFSRIKNNRWENIFSVLLTLKSCNWRLHFYLHIHDPLSRVGRR